MESTNTTQHVFWCTFFYAKREKRIISGLLQVFLESMNEKVHGSVLTVEDMSMGATIISTSAL